MTTSNPYTANGFKDRTDYLESLKDEYPAEAVELLSDMLGPNEDFDGLITDLQDFDQLGMLDDFD
tara:strand:- start:120 stop:314 length:195 start_codon:yes stop_codon:yes gene_type:complete